MSSAKQCEAKLEEIFNQPGGILGSVNDSPDANRTMACFQVLDDLCQKKLAFFRVLNHICEELEQALYVRDEDMPTDSSGSRKQKTRRRMKKLKATRARSEEGVEARCDKGVEGIEET